MTDWVKLAEEEIAELSREKKILPLEELTAYKLADELSDYVWNIVDKWEYFAKKTIGDQFVRAVDSTGANIAESYGRYFFNDSILFLYYSRGSCFESTFWAKKALKRGLITNDQSLIINDYLGRLPKEINMLIKIKKNAAKKTSRF
ncbi:MAG: four helix bundle protein [Patescibacteria group bacterium]